MIDGKGYTVDATAPDNTKPFFHCVGGYANIQLEIKDLTIKGGGASGSGALYFYKCNVKLTRVTLTDSFRQAIWAYADDPNTTYTYELNNMLVEMPNGAYRYNFLHSPGALVFSGNTTVNIRDIVLRDMIGVAAGVINSHYYSGDTSITFSGCLSVERVYAQFSHGAITNNSAGKCTGTIGNGGNADLPNPPPPVNDCGLPLQGLLQSSTTYSLTADCQLTGSLYIRKGLTVNIQGNGYTIKCASGRRGIHSAGNTTITAVVFDGCDSFSIVAHLRSKLVVRRCTFKNQKRPLRIIDAAVTLDQVLFEDNDVGTYGGGSALLVLRSASVTIRNSIFRNNSGSSGTGVIFLAAPHNHSGVITKPAVTLTGSISFDGNSAADHFINGGDQGTVMDNRDSAACDCKIGAPPPGTFPPPPPAPRADEPTPKAAEPAMTPSPICTGALLAAQGYKLQAQYGLCSGVQFQRVDSGGIGIQSVIDQGFLDAIDIWAYANQNYEVCFPQPGRILFLDSASSPRQPSRIQHWSEGNYTCAQASRAGTMALLYSAEPLASRPDAIATAFASAITPLANCQVTSLNYLNIRAEPNGAALSVLPPDETLWTRVRTPGWFEVNFHDTVGWVSADWVRTSGNCGGEESRAPSDSGSSAPASYAPAVSKQAANADGTQSHVVQPGDTLLGIAIAYGVSLDDIMRLNQISNANSILVGQALRVR